MDRQTITVDIAPGSGPIQRIRLSQGDIGRQLGVYIIQNGAAVDCSGYSAHLYVLKPDKNYYEKTCSISSNLISWETAEQETPLAGECKAQIRITSNGMDIGTANFIEAIEATPAAGGTASESLISSMTQYVDAAETAARTAVEAEDTVEEIISTYSGIPGRVTNAENSLAATQDGLAIMANGNTHAAIAAGQAVFVRNHSSLSEGLYWASAAIGTNATLSTSNLTADANGGLNALKAKIGNVGNTDLQSQVTSLSSNVTTINNKFSNVSFKNVLNVNNFTVDLGYTPSSTEFGQLILFNANQGSLNMISISNTINVVKVIGNITLTTTVSGQIITVEASGTLWGDTIIMISHN